MALDKNVLGPALYAALAPFDNQTVDQLVEVYGSIEGARQAMFVAMGGAIIDHFKASGVLTVPGIGLFAGTTAVTGQSVTGKIS